MQREELTKTIKTLVKNQICFEVTPDLWKDLKGKSAYNSLVRQQVPEGLHGVYIWTNKLNDEVLYVGMAGKVKTDGHWGNHCVQQRLLASRGKDPVTAKDIQTSDYIRQVMDNYKIDALEIQVLELKEGQLPSYAEAVMLNYYYQQSRCLPILNKAF